MSNISKITGTEATQFRKIVSEATSLSNALELLGINKKDPRARKAFKRRMADENISLNVSRQYKNYTIDDVRRAASAATCYADILKQIGLKYHGGNLKTIKFLVTENDIDISHFDVNSTFQRNKTYWLAEEIFCKDSKYFRSTLSYAVKRFGVLDYQCTKCGNEGMWNGEELVLDVDHINGDNTDNRIENLRYLCPNCHRQTKTWGRKSPA